jgi:hypothetical protein
VLFSNPEVLHKPFLAFQVRGGLTFANVAAVQQGEGISGKTETANPGTL